MDDCRRVCRSALGSLSTPYGGCEAATVVDWSVTPLSAPGYASGDDLPSWVDLGLSRSSEGDINMFLIDPAGGKVYRTLSHQSRRLFNRCLCTPLWLAQQGLRIGETRMLQATFPPLPEALGFIDVDLINLAPFVHVPVTPIGQVPTAPHPTDLARPPGAARPPLAQRGIPLPAGAAPGPEHRDRPGRRSARPDDTGMDDQVDH